MSDGMRPIRLEDCSPRLQDAIKRADQRMRAAAGLEGNIPVAIRTDNESMATLWVGQPITSQDADLYSMVCAQHTVQLIMAGGDVVELLVGLVLRTLLVGLMIDREETP